MSIAGKPLSNYRPRARQFPEWPASRKALERPPLWEFVLLSMLLHAVAIALFGAPSGGSSEGRAMWGALQVVLQGASLDEGPKLKVDRGLGPDRPDTLTKRARPAPRVAPTRPEPAAPLLKSEPRIESIAPPIEAPSAIAAPPVEVPVVIPPMMNRIPVPEPRLELPEFHVPLPTPVQAAPSPPPAPAAAELPAIVERPAPRVERAPAEAPPIAAPIVQPRVERAIVEPPPVPAPMVQPIPAPIPERVPNPPIARPVESPVVPAVPAPQIERAPVETPPIPMPPIESIAPRVSEPAARPAESAPAREAPVAPPPVAAPLREAPARIERAPVINEAPTPRFNAPGPSTDSIRNNERAPSSTYDPTAPSVDLDAIRKRAGDLSRSGTGQRAILAFPMPPVPPKKSKIEDALDKAHKPDCRTAYSSLGLAAVVPLIANEFGEGTCKW
jgi:hypothetical protein